MDLKPGYKTTEFYQSIAYGIVGTLLLLGIVPVSDTQEIQEYIIQVIGGLMSLISLVNYTTGRLQLKSEALKLQLPQTQHIEVQEQQEDIVG